MSQAVFPGTMPSVETEYLTTDPSLTWTTNIQRQIDTGNAYLIQEAVNTYRPGEHVTENWNAYPLHPAPNLEIPDTRAGYRLVPSASRAGNVFTMLVTPFSDNTAGHLGEGFDFPLDATVAGTYEIDQNGVKLAGGDARQSHFWQARLRPGPSTLRFVLDATRTGALFPLSTSSHTVWTWPSAPESGATVPAGWTCPSIFTTRLPSRSCAAQPLLSLDYAVARESLTGSVPSGSQAVTIDVSHFQPSASTAAITSMQAQVSFDDGATWHDASVTRQAAGRFLAAFSAPDTASFVALKVTATDADGSSIQETLLRAYSITP